MREVDFGARGSFCQYMNDLVIALSDLKTAFFQTNRRIGPFLKKHWLELLGFTLGCLFLEQFFRILSMQAEAVGHVNIGAQVGKAMTGLMLLVIFSIQIPLRSMQDDGELGPMTFWAFSARHSKAYTLEGLYAMGLILIGLVLFVIPAIVVQVALSFFPFVIFCDSRYYQSDLSALKESHRLMKGLMTIGTLFALLSIGGQLWAMQYTERILIQEAPLKWALYAAGVLLTSVYLCLLLYRLYRVRVESLGNGPITKEPIHGSNI